MAIIVTTMAKPKSGKDALFVAIAQRQFDTSLPIPTRRNAKLWALDYIMKIARSTVNGQMQAVPNSYNDVVKPANRPIPE